SLWHPSYEGTICPFRGRANHHESPHTDSLIFIDFECPAGSCAVVCAKFFRHANALAANNVRSNCDANRRKFLSQPAFARQYRHYKNPCFIVTFLISASQAPTDVARWSCCDQVLF